MRNVTSAEALYLDDMTALVRAIRKSIREENPTAVQAYADNLHEALIGLLSVTS